MLKSNNLGAFTRLIVPWVTMNQCLIKIDKNIFSFGHKGIIYYLSKFVNKKGAQ
jgi:hypothetical protein